MPVLRTIFPAAFLLASTVTLSAQVEAEPDSGESAAICSRIDKSLSSARTFFSTSAEASIKSLIAAEKPRQADLYIAVHYLMDHRALSLGPSGATEDRLVQQITDYFLGTFEKGAWRSEGCLLIKLLIGLRLNNIPTEKIAPLEKFYAALIEENWHSESVGECFSSEIDRTYMLGVVSSCSNASDELEAKVGYYLATTKAGEATALDRVKLPFLSDHSPRELRGWWKIIPDVWIGLIHRDQVRKLISAERLESARLDFEQAIADSLAAKPKRLKDADQLLFGHLLTSGRFLDQDRQLLQALLAQQEQDGGFPAKMAETPAGHNARATPTHFAIQALRESKRLLCPGN